MNDSDTPTSVTGDAFQLRHEAGQIGIKAVTPNTKAQQEQSRHFEATVPVDKDVLQITHDTVDSGRRHDIRSFNRKKGIQRKLREVGQRDTQQGQSAQHVQYDIPLG